MHAGYYRHPLGVADVIDIVGLAEKATARVKTLSGGQKRRLDVALGLIPDPDLLFLDEPDDRVRSDGSAPSVGDDHKSQPAR